MTETASRASFFVSPFSFCVVQRKLFILLEANTSEIIVVKELFRLQQQSTTWEMALA
jgi:hypothetical protein